MNTTQTMEEIALLGEILRAVGLAEDSDKVRAFCASVAPASGDHAEGDA